MTINPGADDAKKQADERDKRLKEIDEFFEQARAFVKPSPSPATRACPPERNDPWVRGEKPLMIHANRRRRLSPPSSGLPSAAGE